jgi:O-antigen/teichoic acid export membrane protein
MEIFNLIKYKKEIFNIKNLHFAIKILTLMLGQLANILLVRVTSLTTYSQFVLINSFIMSLCLVNQNGLSQIIVKEISRIDSNSSRYESKLFNFVKIAILHSCIASLFIIIIFIKFNSYISDEILFRSDHSNIDGHGTVLIFASLWILILGILNIITEAFRGLNKTGYASILGGIEGVGGYGKGTIFSSMFFLVCFIFIVKNRVFTINELVITTFSINLVIVIGISLKIFIKKSRIISDWLFSWKFSKELAKINYFRKKYGEMMKIYFLSEIFLLVNSQSDIWLLNLYSNQENIGLYSVSLRTIGIIIIPVSIAGSIYIPKISSCFTEFNEKSRKDFVSVNKNISTLVIPSLLALFALIFFSKYVLYIIYGSNYTAAGTILSILSIKGLVIVMFPALTSTLMMLGSKSEIFKVSFIGMMSSIVFEYLLLLKFGTIGLASGSVLGYAVEYVFAYYLLKKKYSIDTRIAFLQ